MADTTTPTTDDRTLIVVNVRRWFQRTYGNTYHTVQVYDFSEGLDAQPLESGVTYGYGDHYKHTVGELLGLDDPYDFGHYRWCDENDVRVVFNVVDVDRKRDLAF